MPALPSFPLPEHIADFDEYVKFSAETKTVLAALGYDFQRQSLTLPRAPERVGDWAQPLRTRLDAALKLVSMTAEVTRREFLVAPLLLDVALAVGSELHSEFAVDVSPRLHGSLDYLLERENALLVVEANADLSRGFTQLAAELIALDTFADTNLSVLYGAVTIGDVWRFGLLERSRKRVLQDTGLLRVPADLDDLLAILS